MRGGAVATAVISGRVDESVKQRADVIIRDAGETVASVINMVWETIVETGELPPAITRKDKADEAKTFEAFISWLDTLPEENPEYSDFSDDEILALKVADYA